MTATDVLIDALVTIAAQDPHDPHDRPTRLGCVCAIAKRALANYATIRHVSAMGEFPPVNPEEGD